MYHGVPGLEKILVQISALLGKALKWEYSEEALSPAEMFPLLVKNTYILIRSHQEGCEEDLITAHQETLLGDGLDCKNKFIYLKQPSPVCSAVLL